MPQLEAAAARAHRAESAIADLFASSGWEVEVEPASGNQRADLILRREGQRVVVEIKALAEARADRALPLLSQAILQAKAYARHFGGAKPLAVLWTKSASPSLAHQLRSFAKTYADGVAVGIVSDGGLRHFVGDPFEELNADAEPIGRSAPSSSSQVVNIFSDSNQWMLKILLAKDIPEDLLRAPRSDLRSGSALADAAGVSAMSASRFLHQLRNEGFLDNSLQEPRIVRRAELFERWRAAALRPAPEMPLRFLLKAPVREQLKDLLARQEGNACLGLFAAADELKLGHVHGVPPHVLVPKLPGLHDRNWRGVRPALQGETPDFVLRQVAFPRSTFQGAVQSDRWLASDVIQTWLDVGSHPARGAEQAALIYDKVLRSTADRRSQ